MSQGRTQSGPSIAVVMCTYQGERFVAEQIESVFAQTRRPDHLVVIDDASTDGTHALVERLCSQRPSGMQLTLERNPRNLGYIANFDRALALADEDLLFLCDQDDVWHPTKIERMAREFRERPELDLLHTDARLVDANGVDLGGGLFEAIELTRGERSAIHAGHGFDVLLRRNVVTGATAAVRREVVRRASPFPPEWVHDEWLAIVAGMNGCIDCLDEALIDYRQHGGNQIGVQVQGQASHGRARDTRRQFMRRVEARLAKVAEQLEQHGVDAAAPRAQALQDRLRHSRIRAHLPDRVFARARAVGVEALRGGYGRYGFGLRSIVADLLALD